MSLFKKETPNGWRANPISSRFPAVLVCAVLAGCSQVPDAVNPAEWYDSAVSSEEENKGAPANELQADRNTPAPGEDEAFPNLSRVDKQRAAREGGLSADAQGRKYADSVSRQGASGAKDSLYVDDQPPAAPKVEAQQITPAPQPATPVTTAETTPQPSADNRVTLTPQSRPQPPAETEAAAVPASSDYSVDPAMGQRLAQQLAEIRARAADRGSLLPSDLTTGGQGAPTIVISSAGIEASQSPGGGNAAVKTYNTLPSGEVVNRGALPLPSNSTRVATIQFGNGSDALDANDRKILSDVVRLQKQSNGTIRVVGHASQRTQNMEPAKHALTNLRVSEQRANKIAQILTQLGVASNQVLVAAVGDNEPVFLEVMPSGEAGNRRAEIYLSN